MKRIFAIFAVLCLLLLPCQAFAAEETAPEAPKLIVTGVAVPGGELAAGESAGITVTIKNMSRSSAATSVMWNGNCEEPALITATPFHPNLTLHPTFCCRLSSRTDAAALRILSA